jgi:predicted dehydrogenase
MNKVRFSVVGMGALAGKHLEGINKNSDLAQLVSICDVNPAALAKRGDEFSVPEENRFLDYEQMLKAGGFDAVIIVTPDQIHRDQATLALEYGYHVLCEKPLAQSIDDCRAMVEAADRSGKKFMTGQVCRKAPGFVKAKELVDSGGIGELFFVESEYAHDYQFMKPEWRKDPVNLRYSIIGGGCHAIDLLRWIAGDPSSVMALANRKVLTDWPVDDCTIAIMQFPNNVVGKIFCGIGVKRNYTMRTCLYGTKGTIICDNRSDFLTIYRLVENANGTHSYPDEKVPVEVKDHNVAAEIRELCVAILEDKPVTCTAREGSNTVAVGLAAVKSAALGGMPVTPEYIK